MAFGAQTVEPDPVPEQVPAGEVEGTSPVVVEDGEPAP